MEINRPASAVARARNLLQACPAELLLSVRDGVTGQSRAGQGRKNPEGTEKIGTVRHRAVRTCTSDIRSVD